MAVVVNVPFTCFLKPRRKEEKWKEHLLRAAVFDLLFGTFLFMR